MPRAVEMRPIHWRTEDGVVHALDTRARGTTCGFRLETDGQATHDVIDCMGCIAVGEGFDLWDAIIPIEESP